MKSLLSFYREAAQRSFHRAWEFGHIVHFVIVILAGFIVFLGLHYEESDLIMAPFFTLFGAFLLGMMWFAYVIYRDECGAHQRNHETAEKEKKEMVNGLDIQIGKKVAENYLLKAQIQSKPISAVDVQELFHILSKKLNQIHPIRYSECFSFKEIVEDVVATCLGEHHRPTFEPPTNVTDTPGRAKQMLDEMSNWLKNKSNAIQLSNLQISTRCTTSVMESLRERINSKIGKMS